MCKIMAGATIIGCCFLLDAQSLARAQGANFQGLGLMPGTDGTVASGVSADGKTVVGTGSLLGTPSTDGQAYRWTQETGMVGLGFLTKANDASSQSSGTSGDGSVVVGVSTFDASRNLQAFRWTPAEGIVPLGFLPGASFSVANGISTDGTATVGYSGNAFGSQAVRWTQTTGPVGIGFFPGGSYSFAQGTNFDGSVIVGYAYEPGGFIPKAFRWTQTTGMVDLGVLPGCSYSIASATSADGTVVVGFSGCDTGAEAFRWTKATGMVGLGHLPNDTFSQADAVSADGAVVVGGSGSGPFVWTASDGMRSVTDLLSAARVNIAGWQLGGVSSISGDGSVVVGVALSPTSERQAFIARLPRATGIDISESAGIINWHQFCATGKTFAIIEATRGLASVGQFQANAGGAISQNQCNVSIGAYHYSHPWENLATDEAEFFLNAAGSYVGPGFIPPVLDIENPCKNDSTHQGCARLEAMGKAKVSQWIRDWCDHIYIKKQVKCMIYTIPDIARNLIEDDIAQYPLWIAFYPTTPDTDPTSSRPLGPWKGSWAFMQYQINNKDVLGVNKADLDVANGPAPLVLANPN